jgi:hypothetical protein
MGNLNESHELYSWLLSKRSIILGKRHPATMGALLGLGLISPNCRKAFQQLKMATETRKQVLGDNFLTRNANRHLQNIAHFCPEVTAQLAQWNIETMEQQLKSGETFRRILDSLDPRWNVLLEMSKQLLKAGKIDMGAAMIGYLLERLDGLPWSLYEADIQAKRQSIAGLVDIIFEFYPLLLHHRILRADSVHYLENLYDWSGRDPRQLSDSRFVRVLSPSSFVTAKLSLALAFLFAEDDKTSPYDQEDSAKALGVFWGTYTMPYSLPISIVVLDNDWAPYANQESSRHTVHVMYIVSVLARYLKAVHGFIDPEDYELSIMKHGKMEEDSMFIGYSLSLLWGQLNHQWRQGHRENIAKNVPSDMPRFAYDWYMRGFHFCHCELKFWTVDALVRLTMEDNECPGSVFLDELYGAWALIRMDQSESCFSDYRNMYMCRVG